MATPTLINLPPPPSDPVTPSDMGPGTPNSGTTSLSALSTTAIKDGHKGNAPSHQHHHHHHHHRSSSATSASSTNTLDAERADRISRLAGLERISTLRSANLHAPGVPSNLAPGAAGSASSMSVQTPGYFDNAGAFVGRKERSTVGSASATGSADGQNTWANGSDVVLDSDQISEAGVSSAADGLSDAGNTSLVGFGEAADSGGRSMSTTPAGMQSPMQGVETVGQPDGPIPDRTLLDAVDSSSRGRASTAPHAAGMPGSSAKSTAHPQGKGDQTLRNPEL